MTKFSLNYLDHIAIRVKDMEASAQWYKKVLGLKICKFPKWDPYPIFLMQDNFGIALFPAHLDDPELDRSSLNIKIDHFAFNVSNEDFQVALAHYEALDIEYTVKDHYYFHSVYIHDLDGHLVELTTKITL